MTYLTSHRKCKGGILFTAPFIEINMVSPEVYFSIYGHVYVIDIMMYNK